MIRNSQRISKFIRHQVRTKKRWSQGYLEYYTSLGAVNIFIASAASGISDFLKIDIPAKRTQYKSVFFSLPNMQLRAITVLDSSIYDVNCSQLNRKVEFRQKISSVFSMHQAPMKKMFVIKLTYLDGCLRTINYWTTCPNKRLCNNWLWVSGQWEESLQSLCLNPYALLRRFD